MSHFTVKDMGSIIDKVTKKAPCPVLWVFKY